MKKGWKIKKLGEICLFENGDRGKNYPSKSAQTNKGIPFINAGHLNNDGIDFETMNYISKERYNLLGNGKIRKGDILFCLRGSLGKFACVGELNEGAIASSLVIVRPSKSILGEYVMAYFQSHLCLDMINHYKNGAAQPNLSAGSLKKFLIPLPPLSEQKRIVSILDKAFEAIARAKENAEKNLKNARELFESYLQNIFANIESGFDKQRLEDCCDLIVDCEHKTAPICKEKNTGYYSIRTPNIGKGKLLFENANQVSEEVYKKWTRRGIPQVGDLIFAREAPAGNVAMIPSGIKVCLGQRTVLLRTSKNKLHNKYLVWLILSQRIQKILLHHSRGATVEHVNMKDIRNLSMNSLPPIPEQKQMVAKLDALSDETKKLENIYQQKLADFEELKKSVLMKAFEGEL